MPAVFVDTAAWIALLNQDDALHDAAKRVRAELRQRGSTLLTSEFVLLEVADALSAPAQRAATADFLERLPRTGVRVIPISPSLLYDGLRLYRQRADKEWGLMDCTSFVLMGAEGITKAFTSDRHFQQAGFTKLL